MKKIVIFVPHQDDETNLTGNILFYLVKKYDVYIVYSSLDVNPKKALIRKKEAINACAVYGIENSNVIFLGFPDNPNRNGHHFYTDGDKSIVPEIVKCIKTIKPELIIGTDFDFHSDHRMLSLALDEAVKNVLIEEDVYRPRYLKGFCYETAYYGVDDYSASALEKTKVAKSILGNISYNWRDRISIASNASNGFIFRKKAYKALKCHRSQYAVLHARSIINADNVFWEKRTDNLLLRKGVKITATSGDVSKLNDLKVIDTDDIVTMLPTEIDYSKGVWKPSCEDSDPKIEIKFDNIVKVRKLVFHGDPGNKENKECEITVVINSESHTICFLSSLGRGTELKLEGEFTTNIDIYTKEPLAEIEVFSEENDIDLLAYNNVLDGRKNIIVDLIDILFFKISSISIKAFRKFKKINKTWRTIV